MQHSNTDQDGQETDRLRVGRRPFLRSIGAAGVAGGIASSATGIASAGDPTSWDTGGDSYYQAIIDDLQNDVGLSGPGEFIFANNESETWGHSNVSTYINDNGTMDHTLDVSGDSVPFTQATRFEITSDPSGGKTDVAYKADIPSEVASGISDNDTMLAVVYLRAPNGSATCEYYGTKELNSTPYQPSITSSWQPFYCPIEYESGSGHNVQFWLGFQQQTVDIGGFALLNFGQNEAFGDLPSGVATLGSDGSDGSDDDPEEWPSVSDPYYSSLVDHLNGRGLPPAEFIFDNSESGTRDHGNVFTQNDLGTKTDQLDVSGDNVPFDRATRFDITEDISKDAVEGSPSSAQYRGTIPQSDLEGGEVMLAVAYLRSPTENAEVEYWGPNTSQMSPRNPELGAKWQRYYFPVEFTADADGSTTYVQFQLGFDIQTIDVGGFALLNFGQNASYADLPSGKGWERPADPYYATLVDDLRAEGVTPGEFVYAKDEATTFAEYTLGDNEASSRSDLDVSGDDVPFSEAAQLAVTEEVSDPWSISFRGDVSDRAVSSGDVLLGVAYMRTTDTMRAEVTYKAGEASNQQPNYVTKASPSVPQEWTRYYFPIQLGADGGAGDWWTEIWLGADVQTVDIGGLALVDFDQTLGTDDLPVWEDERNIDWENKADQRIQNHRTSDLTVDVVDGNGEAVSGADVKVAMQEHEFDFGTALNADTLINESEAGDQYREEMKRLFNKVVMENQHKWRFWEEDQYLADEATQWAIENGLDIRGHVALWGDVENWAVPMDVVSAMGVVKEDGGVTDPELDPEHVRSRTNSHVEEIIDHYSGYIDEWEVANEVIHQTGLLAAINGDEVTADDMDPAKADGSYVDHPALAEWYQTARDAAPSGTSLAVNDFNTLVGSYGGTQRSYEDQIEFLADQEAGLDTVGMQGHFSQDETLTPAQMLDTFNEYAQYGTSLRISEFDMFDESWDEGDKATFFYQFLKVSFSHDAVDEFNVWGFWDGRHWEDDAPFFDMDWNEKAPLAKYEDLVFNQWWTEKSGSTDSDGTFPVSGAFKGEYEITVTADGEETTKYVTVSDDTGSVEVDVSTSYDPPASPDVDLMDAYRSSSDGDSRSNSDSTEADATTSTPTPTEAPTEEPESAVTATQTEAPASTTTEDVEDTGDATATEVTDESGPGMGVASAVAGLIGVGRYLSGSKSDDE